MIVLARGGGSVADLMPFDDERLCRAIFACGTPVVTSMGTPSSAPTATTSRPLATHVPARTAELVVPSAAELGRRSARWKPRCADSRRHIGELMGER